MRHEYQSGIIPEASSDALFITFEVNKELITQAKDALSKTMNIIDQAQQELPDAQLYACIGISHRVWGCFDDAYPNELTSFPSHASKGISVSESLGDIVFHIRSNRRDASYQLANRLFAEFGSSLNLIDEVSCFKYLNNRDLTGFVDGTENPEGESRKDVALVGSEDIRFQAGSYLNVMRFEHDLTKWEKLDIKTQEDTYGRTKETNEEYPSHAKSVHAHTKRTSLKDNSGNSLEILRHSMPFASLSCKGLMFASYSKSPTPFNLMLKSMIEGDEHGHQDHLMHYTNARTSNAYFVPPKNWFAQLKSHL